jgi:glycosyltransferase involved in cell wall biosynthesis
MSRHSRADPRHSSENGARLFVSVIVPVWNDPARLDGCLRALEGQTYPAGLYEVVVVDNGSKESVGSLVARYGRARLAHEAHPGSYAARNAGLAHARGEFVAFIDSDDVWFEDRLSRQLPLFQRKEVGLVFGNAVLVDYERTPPRRLTRTFFDRVRPCRGRLTKELARGCFIPFSSVLVRRELLAGAGGFTRGRVAADYLKWVELSVACEFDYVEEPVFEYAIHPGGLSHNLVETLEDRIEAFRELLARNTNEELDEVLRRILFNLGLSLRVARARRGSGSRRNGARRVPYAPAATAGERLSWSLKFGRDQLLTRGRWWVLQTAALFSGRNGRP